jgi:hypothetical protein
VPAKPVVKELPAAWTQNGENVLEVRGRTRGSAKSRRIKRAASAGEENEGHDPTADLESTRSEVLVRHVVAGKVQDWPEKDGLRSRPARSAGSGARCYMQRDDHGPSTLCRPGDGRDNLLQAPPERQSSSPEVPVVGQPSSATPVTSHLRLPGPGMQSTQLRCARDHDTRCGFAALHDHARGSAP